MFDYFKNKYRTVKNILKSPKKYKLIFIGLDNSGKTNLFNYLVNKKVGNTLPTNIPIMEKILYNNKYLNIYDMGGHINGRKLWNEYYSVDGIVYLIDALDYNRFSESQKIFTETMSNIPNNIPVLVIGNKIDVPSARSESEIYNVFKLYNYSNTKLFMCTIKNNYNINNALEWITEKL